MPEIRKAKFDPSTSSSDLYYLDGDVVEVPGETGLWLVFKTRKVKERREATLHRISSPTADERARAKRWDPLAGVWENCV